MLSRKTIKAQTSGRKHMTYIKLFIMPDLTKYLIKTELTKIHSSFRHDNRRISTRNLMKDFFRDRPKTESTKNIGYPLFYAGGKYLPAKLFELRVVRGQ